VRIHNETRAQVLAESAQTAVTPWAKGKGLLGRKSLPDGEGLIIETCNSVHTWFMRFPIDLIYVTPDGEILKTASAVPPYRFSAVFRRNASVIELPAGVVERTGSRAGDRLRFE
jgi:uncharacterized membrane protein (UPF0127 family)